MAAIIKLKRGLKANLPIEAQVGEPLITTDEGKLYIGQGAGQPLRKIGDLEDVVSTKASLPVTGVENKLYVVLADELQGGLTTIYIYKNGSYGLVGGGQIKASDVVEDANNRFVTDTQIARWDDTYTKSEVDAKVGTVQTDLNTFKALKGSVNGLAELDSTGKIPVTQIPAIMKEGSVVADITERNAISGMDLYEGLRVFVIDASDDPTVNSGGAEYVYDGTQFIKVAESESLDLVLQWSNIQGRPTSSVADIDDAVAKKHNHTFDEVSLNKLSVDAATKTLIIDGQKVIDDTVQGANQTWSSDKIQAAIVSANGATGTVAADLANHIANTSNPHAVTLDQLVDTTISAPISGNFLAFNGTKWVNSNELDGGTFI